MSASSNTSEAARSLRTYYEPVAYLAIFLAALVSRIVYAFLDNHSVIFNALDASEYLRNAEILSSITLDTKDCSPLAEVLTRSGPVYPGFLLLAQKASNLIPANLINSIFAGKSIEWLVLFQCTATSFTPVLIAYTAARASSIRAAIFAGLLASFHPGMIIGSSRLISEPLATLLISLVLALSASILLTQNTNSLRFYLKGLILGIALGFLQLTRSAMVLTTVAAFTFTFLKIRRERARKTLFTMLIGFALVMIPFVAIKRILAGDGSIVVDRLSSYNLLVGVDLDARGWLAYPFSNFKAAYELNHLEIIKRSLEHSPYRFWELMICKLPRLFAFPWNDFKSHIVCFAPGQLVFFHQMCLSLAAAGLCLVFADGKDNSESSKRFNLLIIVISAFLIHTAYLLFESQPHYALTAMPSLIIMAAVALDRIFSNAGTIRTAATVLPLTAIQLCTDFNTFQNIPALNHPYTALATAATFKTLIWLWIYLALYSISKQLSQRGCANKITISIVALLSIFYSVLPLKCFQNTGEWYHGPLAGQQSRITQIINLKAMHNSPAGERDYYLIFDASNWRLLGQNASILVNGRRLPDVTPSLPLMSLIEELDNAEKRSDNKLVYAPEEVLSAMMNGAGGNNQELRQWFLVPIPEDSVAGQELEVTLEKSWTAGADERLYGSYIFKKNQLTIPGPGLYSWDKAFYGVENKNGFSDMRYLTSMRIEGLTDRKEDLSPSSGIQTGNYNIRLLAVKKNDRPLTESFITSASGSVEEEFPLDQKKPFARISLRLPDDEDKKSLYFATVVLSAQSKAKGQMPVPISVIATTSYSSYDKNEIRPNTATLTSAWTPSYMVLNPGNNKIKFSFPLKSRIGNYRASTIEVMLYRGGRSNGNQYFSVHRLLNTSSGSLQERNRSSISFKELKLFVSRKRLSTPLSAYEIF